MQLTTMLQRIYSFGNAFVKFRKTLMKGIKETTEFVLKEGNKFQPSISILGKTYQRLSKEINPTQEYLDCHNGQCLQPYREITCSIPLVTDVVVSSVWSEEMANLQNLPFLLMLSSLFAAVCNPCLAL